MGSRAGGFGGREGEEVEVLGLGEGKDCPVTPLTLLPAPPLSFPRSRHPTAYCTLSLPLIVSLSLGWVECELLRCVCYSLVCGVGYPSHGIC